MSVISSPLPGDSIWLKALATVPFVGIVAQIRCEVIVEKESSSIVYKCEDILDKKSSESLEQNIKKFIKAIEIKNHYKICGIIRSILEIVVIVTLITLCVFSTWFIVPIVLPVLLGGNSVITLHGNKQMLKIAKVKGGLGDLLSKHTNSCNVWFIQ